MKLPSIKINLRKQTKFVERLITDNSPTILTGLGVIGIAGTAALTWKAALEHKSIIDDAAYERATNEAGEITQVVEFSKPEKFALTWKLYIAPVGAGLLTSACVIGANRISARRAAAIAGVLAMTQDDLKEYKDKVREKMTGPQHTKMEGEIAQEKANKAFEQTQLEYIDVADGDVVCLELYTDRVFSCSRNKIEKAVNEFNRRLFQQEAVCLSEFYDILGLRHTEASDEVGFNIGVPLEVDFRPIFTPNGKPALAFSYVDQPMHRPWEAGSFRDR